MRKLFLQEELHHLSRRKKEKKYNGLGRSGDTIFIINIINVNE